MYWYIKYPLLAVLVIALLGIFGSIFRSCVRGKPDKGGETPPVEEVEQGGTIELPPAGGPSTTETPVAAPGPSARSWCWAPCR